MTSIRDKSDSWDTPDLIPAVLLNTASKLNYGFLQNPVGIRYIIVINKDKKKPSLKNMIKSKHLLCGMYSFFINDDTAL